LSFPTNALDQTEKHLGKKIGTTIMFEEDSGCMLQTVCMLPSTVKTMLRTENLLF